jgi:acetyl esterase/lipase
VLPLAIATCALTWQGSRRGSSDATPAGTEGDTAISHRIISPAALLLRLAAGLALLLPAAGCAPARLLNALVPGDGYRLERDLAYGANPRQRLDLYLPDGLGSPAPVVVFFYGGSWQYGSKADYRFVGQALAAQGLIVAIVDYRLHPEARFPGFVEDGAKAVAWVQANIAAHGGDPGRIHLLGHSAGAHIAALLALDRRYLAAAGVEADDLAAMIGLAGPYDFLPIRSPSIKAVFAVPDLAQTQPITFARAGAPPLLLLTGDQDETVDPGNSDRLARAVAAAGGQARAQHYPRLGHVGIVLALAAPTRWIAPVLADVVAFIKGGSKGGAPGGDLSRRETPSAGRAA